MTDVARIINGRRSPEGTQEGTAHHGSELRRGLSVSSTSTQGGVLNSQLLTCLPQILPEMSAIIRERDALEARKDRLRTILDIRVTQRSRVTGDPVRAKLLMTRANE